MVGNVLPQDTPVRAEDGSEEDGNNKRSGNEKEPPQRVIPMFRCAGVEERCDEDKGHRDRHQQKDA